MGISEVPSILADIYSVPVQCQTPQQEPWGCKDGSFAFKDFNWGDKTYNNSMQ